MTRRFHLMRAFCGANPEQGWARLFGGAWCVRAEAQRRVEHGRSWRRCSVCARCGACCEWGALRACSSSPAVYSDACVLRCKLRCLLLLRVLKPSASVCAF